MTERVTRRRPATDGGRAAWEGSGPGQQTTSGRPPGQRNPGIRGRGEEERRGPLDDPVNRYLTDLEAAHGDFARAVAASELHARAGRHRSITRSELANDVMLEAVGLDETGRPRTDDAAMAIDDPGVRGRIRQRTQWRLNARERLSRVKARARSVDVHDAWDLADRRTPDPADAAILREMLAGQAAARPPGPAGPKGPARTPGAAAAQAAPQPAPLAEEAQPTADELAPSPEVVLHAFARREAATDPKAARRLALHVLVEWFGVPVNTARSAVGATRTTAYRELETMRQMLDDPRQE